MVWNDGDEGRIGRGWQAWAGKQRDTGTESTSPAAIEISGGWLFRSSLTVKRLCANLPVIFLAPASVSYSWQSLLRREQESGDTFVVNTNCCEVSELREIDHLKSWSHWSRQQPLPLKGFGSPKEMAGAVLRHIEVERQFGLWSGRSRRLWPWSSPRLWNNFRSISLSLVKDLLKSRVTPSAFVLNRFESPVSYTCGPNSQCNELSAHLLGALNANLLGGARWRLFQKKRKLLRLSSRESLEESVCFT
jgi:hypothetical protein